MLHLKASKSPRPCGSQQTELNISGLESFDYDTPFAPFGYISKVLLFILSQYYVNLLQNFHFTRQNFFWHSVKPAY